MRRNAPNTPHPSSPEPGDWRVAVPRGTEHYRFPSLAETWRETRHRMHVATHADEWIDDEDEMYYEPIRGWPRFFRLVFGIGVLLPLALLLCMALLRQLAACDVDSTFWLSDAVWFSLMGFAACMIVMFSHTMDVVWAFVYVVGHELTHAAAVVCSFGRVAHFSVKPSGGFVETSKNNLFIALTPYFVPIWALVWMGLLWVVRLFVDFSWYEALLYGGAGFWWAFHLYWSAWIIPREQPDLEENGMFFSLMIVYIMNLMVIAVILWCFHLLDWVGFYEDFLYGCRVSWEFFNQAASRLAPIVDAWLR